jgi:hypothetical protein
MFQLSNQYIALFVAQRWCLPAWLAKPEYCGIMVFKVNSTKAEYEDNLSLDCVWHHCAHFVRLLYWQPISSGNTTNHFPG